MLTDADLQLLTAFVDGELSRRQRKAALSLLNRSSEARAVLQDLQENAHRLKILPYKRLPSEFAGQVLQAIQAQGTTPAPLEEPAPVVRRMPRWVSYSMAAAILLVAFGLGLYLVGPGSDQTPLASNTNQGTQKKEAFKVAFADLRAESKRATLTEELKKEKSLHLDVAVTDQAQAVMRLKEVLQQTDIGLIVEPGVQAQIAKGQGDLLVYLENVRPEEVSEILGQLGAESKKTSTFESVQVAALSAEDRLTVSGLLGVSPTELDAVQRKSESSTPSKKKNVAPAKSSERQAILLASTSPNAATSPEVKSFLASRREHRPGTVQVLLVIHQA